ncbi:MAG: hypothetical protein CMB97_00460 [Flavobacteriaceae bacterium]|nr:hypothetical protein [Flavobacteriaceae bacterium]
MFRNDATVPHGLWRSLTYLFYLSVFFPYVGVANIGTDTQPLSLILGIVILFMSWKDFNFPMEIWIFLLPFFCAIVLLVPSGFSFDALRSIGGYASLFILSAASYCVSIKSVQLSDKLFNSIVYIWLVVGLIQLFFNNQFMVAIIGDIRTTASRGVTSLAPEPSHYGIMCVFLLFFGYLRSTRKWIMLLLVVQIVILSRSFLAVLLLFAFWFYRTIIFASLRTVLLSLIVVFAAVIAVDYMDVFFQGQRVLSLLKLIIQNPILIFTRDASANSRFLHIILPVWGFLKAFGLPHGFGQWEEFIISNRSFYKDILVRIGPGRIMSTYGASLFELGVFGLLIPGGIGLALWKRFKKTKKVFLVLSLIIHTILLTQVPLAFPPLAYFIGYVAAYEQKDRQATPLAL